MHTRPMLDEETRALRDASERPDCPGDVLAALAERTSDGELRAAMHPNTPFETLLSIALSRPALVLRNPAFRLGLIAHRERLLDTSQGNLFAYKLRNVALDPELPEDVARILATLPDPMLVAKLAERADLSDAMRDILKSTITTALAKPTGALQRDVFQQDRLRKTLEQLDTHP